MSSSFTAGETLIVQPVDGDDHAATARSGEPCTFIRYLDAPGRLKEYVRVRFGNDPREIVLRERDLIRRPVQ